MKKIFIFFIMFFCFFNLDAKTKNTWLHFSNGLFEANKKGKPVLVDFTAAWCTWCKKMDEDVFSKSDVEKILNENFICIKVDTEKNETIKYNNENMTTEMLMKKLNITGLPTFMFMDKKGKVIAIQSGYVKKDEFKIILKYIYTSSYEKMTYKAFKEKK